VVRGRGRGRGSEGGRMGIESKVAVGREGMRIPGQRGCEDGKKALLFPLKGSRSWRRSRNQAD